MNTTDYRLAVFDMAGTTVTDRHEVEAAFKKACLQSGLEDVTDERIRALQGYSKKAVFRLLWGERRPGETEEIETRASASYETFKQVLEDHYAAHPVSPTEGAMECFAFLRDRGIRIALTTGFYRRVTDLLLDQLGWLKGLDEARVGTGPDRVIDFSISGEEVPEGRPAPDMIFRAMKVLGVSDSAAVLNFGDTPVDIQSGRNAGCGKVIALTNGTHTKEELEGRGADLLLDSLADFPGIFQTWEKS